MVALASTASFDLAPTIEQLNLRLLKLETRLSRERMARLQAEAIAEKGLADLYERQQRLELLETIATRANQSRSVIDTLQFAIDATCRRFGWAFGNILLVNQSTRKLEPASIWWAEDSDFLRAFVEQTQKMRFASGEGLPGQVLASGSAVWIPDISAAANFPRAQLASRFGLRAALAAPVLVGDETLAVMEFYHREVLAQDSELLHLLSQIGTQVGRVMERKRAEDQLIHDATHDPLTGLPNRMLFSDRLRQTVEAHQQRPQLGYAVLFIDLDRFKLVNDSLGHAAGDTLLTEIAKRLEHSITSAPDETGQPLAATLARLGGDEFCVLIEDVQDHTAAVAHAHRLMTALKQPVIIEGQQVYPSASIGVALGDSRHACSKNVMRDADLAMYRAKVQGASAIEIFDPSLHEQARTRLTLESDLRSALLRQEFVLHYQPIVELATERIVGFEALVRWRRSNGDMVAPGEFIPVAEETGLIGAIGQWVMVEAFSALARWCKPSRSLTMSVNVSPRQFHQADFVELVELAITQSGADPSCIRLEITESVTIRNAERTAQILAELRAIGVRVSIDDFGTGYSSLSYLHQLPFDTLKIDRSFVSGVHNAAQGSEMLQTIVGLARNLRMDVIAEGVETQAQAQYLRSLGCDYAQGFLFSRPVEEAVAAALLNKVAVSQKSDRDFVTDQAS